jgi:hypothetical protein
MLRKLSLLIAIDRRWISILVGISESSNEQDNFINTSLTSSLLLLCKVLLYPSQTIPSTTIAVLLIFLFSALLYLLSEV